MHFTALSTEEWPSAASQPDGDPVITTITVTGVADTPVLHASASAGTTTENTATLLSELSVSTTDGGNDDADTFTATVYVDTQATLSRPPCHDQRAPAQFSTRVITRSLTDVNAALTASPTPDRQNESTERALHRALDRGIGRRL